MRAFLDQYRKSQSGYTLVELMVASAVGLIVMTGLTSVVLTTWEAGAAAAGRVEASSQVRSFQSDAYEDFALSGVPAVSSCAPGDPPPCTITLSGLQALPAPNNPMPVISPRHVVYTWNGSDVDRQVGSGPSRHVATSVIAFSASINGAAPNQTVVVTLTVKMQSYTETQTFQFYPRVNP